MVAVVRLCRSVPSANIELRLKAALPESEPFSYTEPERASTEQGAIMNKLAKKIAVIGVAVVALAGCSSDQTTRNAEGDIVEEGDLGVFVVREGDCIDLPTGIDEVSTFTGVACDAPHDAQVFAAFDVVDAAEYPGSSIIQETADSGCVDRFESFIGVPYAESIYYMQTFIPTPESWDSLDDREVLCVVVPESDTEKLTSDLRGVGV